MGRSENRNEREKERDEEEKKLIKRRKAWKRNEQETRRNESVVVCFEIKYVAWTLEQLNLTLNSRISYRIWTGSFFFFLERNENSSADSKVYHAFMLFP